MKKYVLTDYHGNKIQDLTFNDDLFAKQLEDYFDFDETTERNMDVFCNATCCKSCAMDYRNHSFENDLCDSEFFIEHKHRAKVKILL